MFFNVFSTLVLATGRFTTWYIFFVVFLENRIHSVHSNRYTLSVLIWSFDVMGYRYLFLQFLNYLKTSLLTYRRRDWMVRVPFIYLILVDNLECDQ